MKEGDRDSLTNPPLADTERGFLNSTDSEPCLSLRRAGALQSSSPSPVTRCSGCARRVDCAWLSLATHIGVPLYVSSALSDPPLALPRRVHRPGGLSVTRLLVEKMPADLATVFCGRGGRRLLQARSRHEAWPGPIPVGRLPLFTLLPVSIGAWLSTISGMSIVRHPSSPSYGASASKSSSSLSPRPIPCQHAPRDRQRVVECSSSSRLDPRAHGSLSQASSSQPHSVSERVLVHTDAEGRGRKSTRAKRGAKELDARIAFVDGIAIVREVWGSDCGRRERDDAARARQTERRCHDQASGDIRTLLDSRHPSVVSALIAVRRQSMVVPVAGWLPVVSYGATSAALAAGLVWVWANPGARICQTLRSGPMRMLGILSFGIYLWHPFVASWVLRRFERAGGPFRHQDLADGRRVVALLAWGQLGRLPSRMGSLSSHSFGLKTPQWNGDTVHRRSPQLAVRAWVVPGGGGLEFQHCSQRTLASNVELRIPTSQS